MKRLTGTNKEIAELLYQEQLELSKENRDVESTVQAIIEDVKKRGDEALRDYSAKFDKVDLTDFEVGQDLIDQAFKEIDPEVYQALVNAKENIESYHKHQLETGFEDQPSEGVIRGQLIRPINRVGVYVPGGTAAYPSSVLMNVIPAKIAGVKEIIMITPPQEHFVPAILVAAKLAGVENATVAVKEWEGEVIFLHEVRKGAADRSYGVQVARLAGLPTAVIERAKVVLEALEKGDREGGGASKALIDDLPLFRAAAPQISTTKPVPSPLEARLKEVRPDELSPIAALNLIYELKGLAT